MNILDSVVQKGAVCLYVMARYFYRIGEPILTESKYEDLNSLLMKSEKYKIELEEYFNRTYDDDPIPVEYLKELGIAPIISTKYSEREELTKYFTEDKSLSIKAKTEYSEVFEFYSYCRNNQLDVSQSIKGDGVYSRNLFITKDLRLSLSRGRIGDSFDYTDYICNSIPVSVNTEKDTLVVTAEIYTEPSYLEVLRRKYPSKKFVTPKSSAISMLRVKYDEEDYKHLKYLAFFADGLSDTVSGTFDALEELGFITPPHMLVKWEEIPEDLGEFTTWINTRVLEPLEETISFIPSDGVVVEINDLTKTGSISNQYVSSQMAIKLGPWDFGFEKGKVSSIIIEQRRVFSCAKVRIEPMFTYDNSQARVINCFNPSKIVKNDLRVGSTVYFERNSGAVNILIHGKRLEVMLGNEDGGS